MPHFTGLSKVGMVSEGPHPIVKDGGWQRLYEFENGLGASVVDSSMATMGAAFELRELGGPREEPPQRGDASAINRLLQEIAGRPEGSVMASTEEWTAEGFYDATDKAVAKLIKEEDA